MNMMNSTVDSLRLWRPGKKPCKGRVDRTHLFNFSMVHVHISDNWPLGKKILRPVGLGLIYSTHTQHPL